MRVRRQFLDRNGSPVKLLDVQQNSLIVVKFTVSADVDALENVAITNLFPGGFEIENPRLPEQLNTILSERLTSRSTWTLGIIESIITRIFLAGNGSRRSTTWFEP